MELDRTETADEYRTRLRRQAAERSRARDNATDAPGGLIAVPCAAGCGTTVQILTRLLNDGRPVYCATHGPQDAA